MDKTSIGNRMKGYEFVSKTKLTRRMPVIIRLDGKAFHTWTKKVLPYLDVSLETSPFSEMMYDCMSNTAAELGMEIQNAMITYTQSDEISILLNDWKGLKTDQWFDGNVQKIVSISASMATAFFNAHVYHHNDAALEEDKLILRPAFFDARVFNIPKEEVANYFVWRQQDATRNSINMLGQFYFSHKELQGKNTDQVQEMLFSKHGVNWNDIPTWQKRGYCSHAGMLAHEIPIFTQDRDYIEQFLKAKDDD